MTYTSTITFTLDTICPWTYLAKKRLDIALERVRATNPPVIFEVKYAPYQLYTDVPSGPAEDGEDKWAWYRANKYDDSEKKMQKFATYMTALGVPVGIDFKFTGVVAGTLNAHRVVQLVQERYGEEKAEGVIRSLYRQYFEEEQHPSSTATLLRATTEAGIGEEEARVFVEDEDEGLMEVKMLIREQAGNGVDAVPYIIVEGRRRDLTLQGAKEVEEYVKALETVIKEAV